MIYPLLYNGPLQYFARLVKEEEILLEQNDSYVKQSYRNRCEIMGPNGILILSIPVKRKKGSKSLLKEIRIDYDTPWNKVHWKSLTAAYATSPFFEYFRDELMPFYEKRYDFLVDLNMGLIELSLKMMGLQIPLSMSENFTTIKGEDDPRYFIHPKLDARVADPGYSQFPYHQVFEEKLGFYPNLSILDLLFNEGPGSLLVLKNSLKI